MNKLIMYFMLIITFISSTAQNNDKLMIDEISISTFSFEQTELTLISILGNPDLITDYNNEIDNESWIEFKYSLNSFYFFNHQLISFNLRSNVFYFYNPNIVVGNNISLIENIFPNSYSQKEVLNGLGFIIIDITMEDESVSDSFIVINYDQSSSLITSIHIASK
jgi:hypothetical protein